MARVDAPRQRRSFARLDSPLELPNLIDLQKSSFAWLVDTAKGGLRETIDDVSPIEDYTGNLAVVFEDITFDEPVASIEECREKDLTYARPLTGKVALVEHVGAESVIDVRLDHATTAHREEGEGRNEVMITESGYSNLRANDSVKVKLDLREAVVFSPDSGQRLRPEARAAVRSLAS